MHKLLSDRGLALKDLLSFRRDLWFLAWLLGFVASLSSIVLLSLSGWFITAAAAAGIVSLGTAYTFNYLLPAGFIRFTALSRTAGRYAERLSAHYAVLSLLADLRSELFARIVAGKQQSSMEQMHRLTADIDQLDSLPVKLLLPFLSAISLLFVIAVLLFCTLGFSAFWVLLSLLFAVVIVPAYAMYKTMHITEIHQSLSQQRRIALLRPLSAITALLQWGQWERFAGEFAQADRAYCQNALAQQSATGKTVLCQQFFLALSSVLVLVCGAIAIDNKEISVAVLLAL